MLETVKLNSSPDVSRQNVLIGSHHARHWTKECVTLWQVSWYRRGTFSVGNQTETTCQPERVWMWNEWKKQKHREQKEKELGSPPKGLASYVTQHKCDSSFIWTHKLRMPSLPANSLQRQQSANHRLHKKTTFGCFQKYQPATRNTGHSWPTYSHLIMLAHYTQCNMAQHPLAHATVSNNVGLFQQSEYIYSWRPLMETQAFQSSLTASGKKAWEREGERER